METPKPTPQRNGLIRYGTVKIDGQDLPIPAAARIKGASSQAVYHHIAKGMSPQAAFDTVRPYARRGRT